MQHNPFFPNAKDLRADFDFYATDPIAIKVLLDNHLLMASQCLGCQDFRSKPLSFVRWYLVPLDGRKSS